MTKFKQSAVVELLVILQLALALPQRLQVGLLPFLRPLVAHWQGLLS